MNNTQRVEEYTPERVGVYKRLDESILPDLAFAVIKEYVNRFPDYAHEWVNDLEVIRGFLFSQSGKLKGRAPRELYSRVLTKESRKVRKFWGKSKYPTIKCLSMIVQLNTILVDAEAIEPSKELQAVYDDIEFYLLKELGLLDKDGEIISEEVKMKRTPAQKADFRVITSIMDSATKQVPKLLKQLKKGTFFPHVTIT